MFQAFVTEQPFLVFPLKFEHIVIRIISTFNQIVIFQAIYVVDCDNACSGLYLGSVWSCHKRNKPLVMTSLTSSGIFQQLVSIDWLKLI